VKIRILPAAEQDLISGFQFYEAQEKGLGHYFLDSVFADIDSLQLYAGIHPIHFELFHRLLTKRFPFAVYYQIDGDQVLVVAVLDCRRRPAWIRERLK
jgi:plasmid stabilization system protein ParE